MNTPSRSCVAPTWPGLATPTRDCSLLCIDGYRRRQCTPHAWVRLATPLGEGAPIVRGWANPPAHQRSWEGPDALASPERCLRWPASAQACAQTCPHVCICRLGCWVHQSRMGSQLMSGWLQGGESVVGAWSMRQCPYRARAAVIWSIRLWSHSCKPHRVLASDRSPQSAGLAEDWQWRGISCQRKAVRSHHCCCTRWPICSAPHQAQAASRQGVPGGPKKLAGTKSSKGPQPEAGRGERCRSGMAGILAGSASPGNTGLLEAAVSVPRPGAHGPGSLHCVSDDVR